MTEREKAEQWLLRQFHASWDADPSTDWEQHCARIAADFAERLALAAVAHANERVVVLGDLGHLQADDLPIPWAEAIPKDTTPR